MGTAALISGLVTALFGLCPVAVWLIGNDVTHRRGAASRWLAPGILGLARLAVTGLVSWVIYVLSGADAPRPGLRGKRQSSLDKPGRTAVPGPHRTPAEGRAVKKHITAAATAAAAVTVLAAGCASTQDPSASPQASPAAAGAAGASTAARAASNPACKAQLSAWRPTGERFERMLRHDAGAAESGLQSLITQTEEGAQPSISAALTDSGTLASTARQMLGHHLPPSCVPHMRAALTAAMLSFEKQAADMNNASLALSDWNAGGAERLLKAASHDITTGATGISQATADFNNYQG